MRTDCYSALILSHSSLVVLICLKFAVNRSLGGVFGCIWDDYGWSADEVVFWRDCSDILDGVSDVCSILGNHLPNIDALLCESVSILL